MTEQDKHEANYYHLLQLREENLLHRNALTQQFMKAIMQSINDEEQDSGSFFWDENVTPCLIHTFQKLVESGMAIVDFKNPQQLNGIQGILKFVDEALQVVSKKTNNFRDSPMKQHHINWLESFRSLISSITWQLHIVLGSQM